MKLHIPMTMLMACLALALAPVPAGSQTALPTDMGASAPQSRTATRDLAQATLERLYAQMPEARGVVRAADGYAVFVADGSGQGFGLAIKNNGREETFMRIRVAGGTGGSAIAGGFSQVWVFLTEQEFRDFTGVGHVVPEGTVFAPSTLRAGALNVPGRIAMYHLSDSGLATTLTMPETLYRRDARLARVDPG